MKVEKAAELLTWLRKNRTRLAQIPADLLPLDLDEAYEIQATAARLQSAKCAGFKIECADARTQTHFSNEAAFVGRFGALDVRRSGTKIAVPDNHLRAVNAEIIFEIGLDLPARLEPYTVAQVAGHLRAAFAGIELCNYRLLDHEASSLALRVADNCGADLLVVGERLSDQDLQVIFNLPVTLKSTSRPAVMGSTSRVLGNPLRAVTWLANWLSWQGLGLRSGQLIASGGCTIGLQPAVNDRVTAQFGSGASASFELLSESSLRSTDAKLSTNQRARA